MGLEVLENKKMIAKQLKTCSKCQEQDMMLPHEDLCQECQEEKKQKNKSLLSI